MTQQNPLDVHQLVDEDSRAVDLEPVATQTSVTPPVEEHQLNPNLEIDITSGEPQLRLLSWERAQNRLATAPRRHIAAKRLIDLVGASFLLVILAPLMLVTAIAVATTSRGSVLYAQRRVGYKGQPFSFLKFRSMIKDAETHLDNLSGQNEQTAGPVFKIKNDPRITTVGRVLRKTSIDELPQLVHVIKGDMSLVGPRPPLPSEVAAYSQWELQRLAVKPGITCIWQVSGRSELDFDTWVAMDLEYIETWSFWLDMKLLAKTVPAVLSRRGAY